MDPDANIAAQRRLIARLRAHPGDQDVRAELAGHLDAFIDWLAVGGFPPAASGWRQVTQEAAALLATATEGVS